MSRGANLARRMARRRAEALSGQQRGDALVILYGLWAVAALGRATYQYLYRHPASFVPTHLSAVAGGLYILIIVGLQRRSAGMWYTTVALLGLELAAVLVVGVIDAVWHPFAYATVWSGFGAGYLFVPLILPLAGLRWMAREATRRAYGLAPRADDSE
jgi:hypothetical protein